MLNTKDIEIVSCILEDTKWDLASTSTCENRDFALSWCLCATKFVVETSSVFALVSLEQRWDIILGDEREKLWQKRILQVWDIYPRTVVHKGRSNLNLKLLWVS